MEPLNLGVLTSFSPNHLDWHGTLAHYVASKGRLLSNVCRTGVSVADLEDSAVCGFLEAIGERRAVRQRLIAPQNEQLPPLAVPGEHNRRNAALAAAAARCAGCWDAAIARGLKSFAGLPHRLEALGMVEGREFYNDSMATTPESAAAAVATFSGRVWLLAGGHDKGGDMARLGAAIARHARGAHFWQREAVVDARRTRRSARTERAAG
jgi:UDP-N-acetylmuramoylalanine--D-glutamate ligase